MDGIRIFAGIEVDILADGTLDLSDSVLEQMDIVIASVHSHFNQSSAEMTDRLLKVIENPNTSLIGHPTGRLLLRRDAYHSTLMQCSRPLPKNKVAMELNAYPDSLDLVRPPFAARQAARREDCDQYRFASHFASG